MNNITSLRYLSFLGIWTCFWMFVPLFVVKFFSEGPMNPLWVIAAFMFVYFIFPKINVWLIHHTPFGRVWSWARANEETP
ncbi:hypothetical protein LCGC14_1739400 [marine sediment metagenome]|uniref:Uncharacterized protein n=1 Tax=marine sediment metagenome TaxID=412755 RepID=A0A0F9JMG1_9ZZZZ